MAESTVLLEERSRTVVIPGFLAVVGVLVLLRGFTTADTTGGRIGVAALGGGLLLFGGGMVVYELRRELWRLEITPEHIVLFHRPAAGIRIGTSTPIRVQRRLVGGPHPRSHWILADASDAAVRFRETGSEAVYGVEAQVDINSFDPKAVLDAVQRAGWPVEWRP